MDYSITALHAALHPNFSIWLQAMKYQFEYGFQKKIQLMLFSALQCPPLVPVLFQCKFFFVYKIIFCYFTCIVMNVYFYLSTIQCCLNFCCLE